MGKIEVRGSAERTVDYDLMKICINFHSSESTPEEASTKVMKECEEFLGRLKQGGFDISGIALKLDEIEKSHFYCKDDPQEYYYAGFTD